MTGTTTTRLAELLNSYADLVSKGHADRDITDPFERDTLTDILRDVAAQSPDNQHVGRQMAVRSGSEHDASHATIVRAIDIVTNIL